jgi:uncharacterized protein (DUF4213/DUF364 family)
MRASSTATETEANTNKASPKTPLLEAVLETLPDGKCLHVCIGLHWTAVVVNVQGEQRCGLASSFVGNHVHGVPDVPQAGQLETMSGLELAALARTQQPALVSIGVAAINALLPREPDKWEDINAEEVIAKYGEGKSVALVGHFPFTSRLRPRVGELNVLELRPQPGDLHADQALDVIPAAEVVAITGTTLINQTFDDLLTLCSPQAFVILLGPSTFLSPVFSDYGVDLLCGSVVTDFEAVLKTIRQGGTFRQVHKAGVRLVSVTLSPAPDHD